MDEDILNGNMHGYLQGLLQSLMCLYNTAIPEEWLMSSLYIPICMGQIQVAKKGGFNISKH